MSKDTEAPDLAKANKEAVEAYIQNLPKEYAIKQQWQPKMDAIEFESQQRALHAFIDSLVGSPEQEGLLQRQYAADLEYMPKFLELDLQHALDSAMGMADAQWEVQEKYGDKYLDTAMEQARKADPDWFATREQAADLVMAELAKGSQLTDAQARQAEQSIRGAQAARGNVLGPAASIQEALQKFNMGEQLKQQRLTNAMAFLGGQQPGSQFAGVQQAQQGAAPFNPMQRTSVMNNFDPQGGFNPAASVWDRGMINQNATNVYNTQYDANKTNAAAKNQMMGQMMGMAGGLMMCWVAREVYGADDPRWPRVRDWMLERAPDDLRKAYARHGEAYANYIADKPELKARWRRFFDQVLEDEQQLARLGIGGGVN